MNNKVTIFLHVVQTKSFTQTAKNLGYSQSAVSQAVKSLEEELGTILFDRSRDHLELTSDGKAYLPYLESIQTSSDALEKKKEEMLGLTDSLIRIGTFTSVSRNVLPPLLSMFKEQYPDVRFELIQGNGYDDVEEGIRRGDMDFGFVNEEFSKDFQTKSLYKDHMIAVLPKGHPLTRYHSLSLKQLSKEPFILLDEGEFSVTLDAFRNAGVQPNIRYRITDDYSILAMVKQNLGISMLYRIVVTGYEKDVEIREIKDSFSRPIALAYRSYDTLSIASRHFVDFTLDHIDEVLKNLEK